MRRSLHLGLLLGLFVCHAERATPLGCALSDAALQAAEELCVDEVSASERDTCLAAALEEALGSNQEQPGEHLPDRKHAPELPPDQALPLASAPYASFFQPDEVEEDGLSDEASALLCTPRRRGSVGSDGVKEERMHLHCTDLTRTSSHNLIRRVFRMPEPWPTSLIPRANSLSRGPAFRLIRWAPGSSVPPRLAQAAHLPVRPAPRWPRVPPRQTRS